MGASRFRGLKRDYDPFSLALRWVYDTLVYLCMFSLERRPDPPALDEDAEAQVPEREDARRGAAHDSGALPVEAQAGDGAVVPGVLHRLQDTRRA